jgi:CRP-like cAMP-binding protein
LGPGISRAAPGIAAVFRNRDLGRVAVSYYAIADGEVEITARGRLLGIRRRCEGFGEIALLRDSSRTATAVARTDTLLYRLDKEPFLAAVTGHTAATHAAEQLVQDRLATVTAAPSEAET